MVMKNGSKTARTVIKKPAFAVRCLKLVFTYLTGILDFTMPFLPVFIKNKIIKPLPMLPTTKPAEKEKSALESTEFELINLLKLDSEPRFDDINWDRSSLRTNTTDYLKNDTSENSIPKRIKHEIESRQSSAELGINKYVNDIYANETGAYNEITSQSVRPSSLKFNDSGISDIGSSANSVASTPEIEQNNAAINEQQVIDHTCKSSGNNTQKSKRKNRKSRNRGNSVNKQFIEQNDLASGQNFNKNFDKNSILNTGLNRIDSEQKTDNNNGPHRNFNLEQTIGHKYQSNISDSTQQQAADCTKISQQTSDVNCNAQPNILFDLPLLSIPDENSDEEVDEELEKFKMYCQETNKLFILNDSKIVIEWENM